jgi:subtilisin family serine protease
MQVRFGFLSSVMLVVILSVISLGARPLARAQTTAATLGSTPAALSATLPLGGTQAFTVTLRNNGSEPVTPQLFEANAATPTSSILAAAPADAQVPLPAQLSRVDPQLTAQTRIAGAPTEFLVFLADRPDLADAYTISDWAARGRYVVASLRDHAERSQADLRAHLEARGREFTPLWAVNAILVRGDGALVTDLAARPDVAMLRANRVAAVLPPLAQHTADLSGALQQLSACSADDAGVCWHLRAVGADRVWNDFGVRGAGITVGSIDSGVQFSHPALQAQYRGTIVPGTYSHHYNWYDAVAREPAPVDAGYHGTHTMGTIVGRGNSATVPAVGVAPDVRWITARACESVRCDEAALILAAQWMLAPTDLSGQNSRPDLRPHIINNSWSAGQGNYNWYAGYVAAWRAAGIFPVFAAGNSGNLTGCSTIQSPADYNNVVGVGSAERNGELSTFSSIGPTVDGRAKPDLIAPGSGIFSTVPDLYNNYLSLRGTSMATPHIAGAVALLWSANPALIGDYDATYLALTATAQPAVIDQRFFGPEYAACPPTTYPNSLVGYGRLDAYAAVARVTVDVPWLALSSPQLTDIQPAATGAISVNVDMRRVPGPGIYAARVLVHGADLTQTPLIIPVTITVPDDPNHAQVSGMITRSSDGGPLQGQVEVAGGAIVTSDASGRFALVLPPAATPYTLTARALEYAAASISLTITPGAQLTRDFALVRDVPRLALTEPPPGAALAFAEREQVQVVIANAGTRRLDYTLSLPPDRYGVWRSDNADGPPARWIAPPAGAVTLALADDSSSAAIDLGFGFPFFDSVYEELWVSANGFISFSPLAQNDARFVEVCLPLIETAGAAIVPLRVDMDPSQGGRVSYARLAEGFLISWENVPIFSTPERRLSFQALLLPDGRVQLNYAQVAGLRPADRASYGLQGGRSLQMLGCERDLELSDGLTIELRPQPSVTTWAELPAATGTVAPGATAEIPVDLFWAPAAVGGWPASARIVLTSNDPDRPTAQLYVRLETGAAPRRTFFPWMGHIAP